MEETWAQVQGKNFSAELPFHGWKCQMSISHDTSQTRSVPHLQRAMCRKQTANAIIQLNEFRFLFLFLIWISLQVIYSTWIMISLKVTLPEDVSDRIRLLNASSLVKA